MTERDRARAWEARQQLLRIGAFGAGDPIELIPLGPSSTEDMIVWPSGLAGLDRLVGGFHGLSVLAGSQGLGKSIAATHSSLLAAEHGWRVFYIDGENDRGDVNERVLNHFGCPFAEWPDWMSEPRWTPLGMRSRCTLREIAEAVAERITEVDERVLIVIDSMNRLAERMELNPEMKGGYWKQLSAISDWASNVAQASRGEIGVLLLSEVNKEQKPVGHGINYAAKTIVRLKRVKAKADRVEVRLDKVRRGAEAQDLGVYFRIYERCRFDEEPPEGDESGGKVIDMFDRRAGS